jgi:hypothetical protein
MISWLRRISPPVSTSQRGSVLPVVIIFALTGLITVFSFLYFNLTSSRYSFDTRNVLQANLNARSGVYIAFNELCNNGEAKSIVLPEIDARDSSFGKSLFDDLDSASVKSGPVFTDTSENGELTFGSGAKRYRLYSLDTLDSADVTLTSDGGSGVLRSVYTDGIHTATVEATLGSRIPFRPDTVAVCYNTGDWDASGVTGTTFSSDHQPDSVSMWLRSMISNYREQIVSSDTGNIDPPATIQSNRDLSKIKRVVSSDLILDGSFNKLVWRDTGTFVILGRLDVSSEVEIEGIRLVVGGEITLNGESSLNNVSLFSQSKIFFADDSKFSGNAMALNSVAIYGNAEIRNRSTILVCGESSSLDVSELKGDVGNSGVDTKRIYAIEIGDKALVDGVLIAVGSPGDIKTHEDVRIRGVMIAQKEIGHLGKLSGLMTAGRFIDPDVKMEQVTPSSAVAGVKKDPKGTVKPTVLKNVIKGDAESLYNIDDYKLPFFIGKLTIAKWREF